MDKTIFAYHSNEFEKNGGNDGKMTLEALSLQYFDIMTPNFVCAIVTSHRTHQNYFITVPPVGQKW